MMITQPTVTVLHRVWPGPGRTSDLCFDLSRKSWGWVREKFIPKSWQNLEVLSPKHFLFFFNILHIKCSCFPLPFSSFNQPKFPDTEPKLLVSISPESLLDSNESALSASPFAPCPDPTQPGERGSHLIPQRARRGRGRRGGVPHSF